MPRQTGLALWVGMLAMVALSIGLWWIMDRPQAKAQEPKRFLYKVVDVQPDNTAMQATLNEYGAAGWELVVVGMGSMSSPRLIFKK